MVDLRQYFRIWERCGNTRFFRRDPENPWQIVYLNPLDGILVTLRMTSLPPQPPVYELTVRDARRVDGEVVAKAHATEPPWVKKSVTNFFKLQMVSTVLETVKEHYKKATPGDAQLRTVLSLYEPGGAGYRREGRLPASDKPLLEEMLEGVYLTISKLQDSIVDYGRNLSVADAKEALEGAGILEC